MDKILEKKSQKINEACVLSFIFFEFGSSSVTLLGNRIRFDKIQKFDPYLLFEDVRFIEIFSSTMHL